MFLLDGTKGLAQGFNRVWMIEDVLALIGNERKETGRSWRLSTTVLHRFTHNL
jgi:hypothetical protein